MSREILFRAKWLDNGEWVEGDLLRETNTFGEKLIQIFVDDSNGYWSKYEIDPSTVCQYTGLKDASGNKIWENDIIVTEPFNRDVGIVRYGEYGHICGGTDLHVGFYVNWQSNNAMWRNDLGYWAKDYSICGNVFDTPELLEGGTGEDD